MDGTKLLLGVILLFVFSCKKKEININPIVTQLPVLYKTLDSTISTLKENRQFYYYTPNGKCDTIIYESQNNGAGIPSWGYTRLRFEYNNTPDTLPRKTYKKSAIAPEELYSELEYSNTGKVKKIIIFGNTFTYTYDINDILVRDSQFNSFNTWQYSHIYTYDPRGNVTLLTRITPTGSSSEIYTYDSAINPFHNKWAFQPDPISLSPNNITSQGFSGQPNPFVLTTYQYNSFNLPVKSYLYQFGQPIPTRSKTYFYQ